MTSITLKTAENLKTTISDKFHLKGIQPSADDLRKIEIGSSSNQARLISNITDIKVLSAAEIVTLQNMLQHGNELGYWQTPEKWQAVLKCSAMTSINLRRRIVQSLPEAQRRLISDRAYSASIAHNSEIDFRDIYGSNFNINARNILEEALLCITRYLILLRIGPVGLGRSAKNSSLDPSYIQSLAYTFLPKFIAIAVSKRLTLLSSNVKGDSFAEISKSSNFFQLITLDDISSWSKSQSAKAALERVRMSELEAAGLWDDIPSFTERLKKFTVVSGPAALPAPEVRIKTHLPLPDEYVAVMGHRSLWLIQQLAPNILAILNKILEIWDFTEILEMSPTSVESQRRYLLKRYLKNFEWRDSNGVSIKVPPFKLRLTQLGKKQQRNETSSTDTASSMRNQAKDESDSDDLSANTEIYPDDEKSYSVLTWPPRSFAEIMGLAYTLQLSHLFVTAISTAARKSETLSMKRNCIEYIQDKTTLLHARTFKLVERHEGRMREWALPKVAVQAIEQQVRLVSLAEKIGPQRPDRTNLEETALESTRHLWAQISGQSKSDRTAPLLGIGAALHSYARALDMDVMPGGQRLRKHRIRKTVARLVGLALIHGPKILMKVLGHESMEMTIGYMLADTEFQAEVEQVGRELRVLRAKEIIEKIVAQEDVENTALSPRGYGGFGAQTIGSAITFERDRLHRRGEQWGANSAAELAELLTLQGKAWVYVRPGVLCTKFPGTESGPCNKSLGRPEPSNCQTACKHRLEEEFLRSDVDGAIRESVNAYLACAANGDELVQSLWAGQVKSHLVRFPDIQAKWMENVTVQAILQESRKESVP